MNQLKKSISIMLVLSLFALLNTFALGAEKEKSESPVKLVNINSAGVEELSTLPRIGKKMAQRIIDFREKNGKFNKPADLMKVKGIGEKMFKRLKQKITI